MIHRAKDLTPDQKHLIEGLMGRRVQDDETVSIQAFAPPHIPEERRLQIAEELKKYFAEVDSGRQSATAEEADEIITEAIRSTRSGYRPHP
jgi:hypothetical protein